MRLGSQSLIDSTNIRWKRFLISIIIWVASEIGLTWLGWDDLADCGEYLFKHREVAVEVTPALQELPNTTLVIPQLNASY